MNFADLDFGTHPSAITGGSQAKVFFDNGYGASIVSGGWFYTSENSPYELAVLKGKEGKWSINYDTPITDDVIGYLTESDVSALLTKIEALPAETFSHE